MRIVVIAGVAFAILVVLAVIVVATDRHVPPPNARDRGAGSSDAAASSDAAPSKDPEVRPGFLYGRVTTVDGATYEGRLRWGRGGEEAFWGDYFNGAKRGNRWLADVPPERLPKELHGLTLFGIPIIQHERPVRFGRLFMARFGDITRIEAERADVRVTLKSGAVFDLRRFESSDFDDGVKVWDEARGVVELGSRKIRAIELLPTPALRGAPGRLHGTVRTRLGEFTGFVQWNRTECTGTDTLDAHAEDGDKSVRFDTIRSIERRSENSSAVTLLDGKEVVLSGNPEVGNDNRGVYVDDPRYGRVLVSWDAFERIDFTAGDSGPAYGDFPPGGPITGSVTTRAGTHFTGRLVYDLDESEVTETFDAPAQGVTYTIPFGLIASVVPPGSVTLRSGEKLELEHKGDLGSGNGGVLVFVGGEGKKEYVPWADVAVVDIDRPAAMYPPLGAP